MIGGGRLWNELRKRITEKIADEENAAGSGKAKDWGDYQKRVGYITALRWVMAEVQTLFDDAPRRTADGPDRDFDEVL